jgi:hypothetical protein
VRPNATEPGTVFEFRASSASSSVRSLGPDPSTLIHLIAPHSGIDCTHPTNLTRVSERLKRLEDAIAELEGAQKLRPDAAARLAKYGESRERLLFARASLDWTLQESQPPEAEPANTPTAEEPPGKKQKKSRWLRR